MRGEEPTDTVYFWRPTQGGPLTNGYVPTDNINEPYVGSRDRRDFRFGLPPNGFIVG